MISPQTREEKLKTLVYIEDEALRDVLQLCQFWEEPQTLPQLRKASLIW